MSEKVAADRMPGQRQTVDRARHPELGEGCLVYDNGPAFFQADIGLVEPLRSVGLGGCSSNPRRSWMTAVRKSGERIELETTDRQHGDTHVRAMTYDKQRGWLVHVQKPLRHWRWEPDGGAHEVLDVNLMQAGPPGTLAKQARRKNKSDMPHEKYWLTYTTRGAREFVWCREEYAGDVCWPKGYGAPTQTTIGGAQ